MTMQLEDQVEEHDTSIAAFHRRALDSTRGFVAGIGPDRWANPTPCDDWDVRGLVNHVVVGNLWAAELVAGRSIDEVGDRLEGDRLGADPLRAYDESAEAAALAFEAPGALEAPCAVSYGPVPGEVYAGHRLIDVLVHGWDLAVATDQDAQLDPELVDACWNVIEPQLVELRASGMFGAEPDGPFPTNRQSRLLVMLGRWSARCEAQDVRRPVPISFRWRPRQESNLRSRLRRPMLYPLSYEGEPANPRAEDQRRRYPAAPEAWPSGPAPKAPRAGMSPVRPQPAAQSSSASVRFSA